MVTDSGSEFGTRQQMFRFPQFLSVSVHLCGASVAGIEFVTASDLSAHAEDEAGLRFGGSSSKFKSAHILQTRDQNLLVRILQGSLLVCYGQR